MHMLFVLLFYGLLSHRPVALLIPTSFSPAVPVPPSCHRDQDFDATFLNLLPSTVLSGHQLLSVVFRRQLRVNVLDYAVWIREDKITIF